jgi:hypothetical protein
LALAVFSRSGVQWNLPPYKSSQQRRPEDQPPSGRGGNALNSPATPVWALVLAPALHPWPIRDRSRRDHRLLCRGPGNPRPTWPPPRRQWPRRRSLGPRALALARRRRSKARAAERGGPVPAAARPRRIPRTPGTPRPRHCGATRPAPAPLRLPGDPRGPAPRSAALPAPEPPAGAEGPAPRAHLAPPPLRVSRADAAASWGMKAPAARPGWLRHGPAGPDRAGRSGAGDWLLRPPSPPPPRSLCACARAGSPGAQGARARGAKSHPPCGSRRSALQGTVT